ncbi:acid protease [Tilletiopsis washingtonensis]|uniref:Acid protease n=1 Tax=Tilletiopsis washingtonensis TaxID=58919 RepID=A0A316ZHS4_9BASI|nr:acid protease [Tilletiopsis washingtonensis]PWO01062.1 acid protease [Tilletiopsis washingtonensis]
MQLTLLSVLALAASVHALPADSSAPVASVEYDRRTSELEIRAATPERISSQLRRLQNKYATSFANFQLNEGRANPLLNASSIGDVVARIVANAPAQRRAPSGTVPLTDVQNELLWVGPLSYGTPAQTFQLDFDTGSSDTFVQPGLYKPAASTSSTTNGQKFRVAYGDGTMATGTVYRETVTIGGLKVKNQAVGAADQSTLDDTSSNGISGFGFPSIAQFKADPVWVTLYKQGKLGSKAQFAFGLSRTKARLDLGGVDKASYSGSLVYSKVDSSSGFWQTPGTLNGKAINAIIDTGTTVVVGPPADVLQICLAAGGTPIVTPSGTSVQVLCGYTPLYRPKFVFTFGGASYTLSAESEAFAEQDGLTIAGIIGADIGLANAWIVGDTFLQNVYAAFEGLQGGNTRVGFAPRKL